MLVGGPRVPRGAFFYKHPMKGHLSYRKSANEL